MNCPVCQFTLPQSIPPFCPQCAWDLKSDLTLNTFLSNIPESEFEIYRAKLNLAQQNWEHIHQIQNGHTSPQSASPFNEQSWKESETMNQDTGEPFELRNGDMDTRVDLNNLVKDYKLFVDTGSLLEPTADKLFLDLLLPLLQRYDTNMLVSVRTIDNLEYFRTTQNSAAQAKAAEALKILKSIQNANRLLDAKDPHPIAGDRFDTSKLFAELFIAYQLKYRLCLITQNESIALQILKNSRSQAIDSAKDVKAVYVDNGNLSNWIPRIIGKTKHRHSEVSIAHVAAGFKVVADTSAILLTDASNGAQKGLPFFRDILLPEIVRQDNKLILPHRVIKELQKHSRSTDKGLSINANEALSVLMMYDTKKRLVIGEDTHEVEGAGHTFADPVFIQLGIRFQSSHDICFITQDTNLAKTLLDNRHPGTGREYLVTFIPQDSQSLVRWESKLANYKASAKSKENQKKKNTSSAANNPHSQAGNAHPQQDSDNHTAFKGNKKLPNDDSGKSLQQKQRIEPFSLVKNVYALNNQPVSVSLLPGVGGMVLDSKKKPVRLIGELAEGGEGKIFRTDTESIVCKIYHGDRITESRRKKLELMVSRDIHIPAVCWPIDVVTNTNGEFVGYLMPMVGGKIMKTSVFAKPLLKKIFPNWTRIHLTQMAVAVLNAIERLHRLNIFIGDINPQNILVKDEHTIFIVDTDSFQVEGFPCPVGTETFTPPERQGLNYADFLRTEQDEFFAVTTMLFMILFVGKAPYSSQGGGEAAENIRNRTFAYDRETDERPPIGAWQFIWSHLHPAIKHDFLDVFSKGERVSIKEMIKHLNLSLAAMKKGERSSDLFPEKPWQREGETVVVQCDSCPPGKADHEINVRYAEKLRSENRSFRCSNCVALKKMGRLETTRQVECTSRISSNCAGRAAVSIDHLNRLAEQNQSYICHACNHELNYRMVDCALHISPNCAGRSRVAVVHLNNLASQNRSYWCNACQEAEKTRRANERRQRQSSSYQSAGRRKSGGRKSQNKGCFVATATYQSVSAPQVVILRAYRDQVLLKSKMGMKMVDLYYQVGPFLAEVVNNLPFLRPCCRKILDHISDRIHRKMLKSHPTEKERNHGG